MQQDQRGGLPAAAALQTKPAAWDEHFDDVPFEPDDRRALLVRELAQHFVSAAGWRQLLGAVQWHARTLLELDWLELVALTGSSDLQEAVLHAPNEALACIACAAYEVGAWRRWAPPRSLRIRNSARPLSERETEAGGHLRPLPSPHPQVLFRVREADTQRSLPRLQQPGRVLVRLSNHPDSFRAISTIKADAIGRLVTVRGTLVRATSIQPMVTGGQVWVCI